MKERITIQQLETTISHINRITGNPEAPYKGNGVANIGCYHLSRVSGGVRLQRIADENGAVTGVFRSGYISKRDLYNRLQAFLDGLSLI